MTFGVLRLRLVIVFDFDRFQRKNEFRQMNVKPLRSAVVPGDIGMGRQCLECLKLTKMLFLE